MSRHGRWPYLGDGNGYTHAMRRSRAGLCILIILGFFLQSCSYLPTSIDTGDAVDLTIRRNYLVLTPVGTAMANTGLIFYPGALVDPASYVTSLAEFARRGYQVLVLRVPANLAILDSARAEAVLDEYEAYAEDAGVTLPSTWVGAGHSLGGTCAAFLAADRPTFFVGLAFLASYPADSASLADWGRPVLSISASEDGLATPEKIEAAKNLLPASTTYVTIDGGNHAQFGNYGDQDGDGTASIGPTAQWTQTADALENFFTSQGWAP